MRVQITYSNFNLMRGQMFHVARRIRWCSDAGAPFATPAYKTSTAVVFHMTACIELDSFLRKFNYILAQLFVGHLFEFTADNAYAFSSARHVRPRDTHVPRILDTATRHSVLSRPCSDVQQTNHKKGTCPTEFSRLRRSFLSAPAATW